MKALKITKRGVNKFLRTLQENDVFEYDFINSWAWIFDKVYSNQPEEFAIKFIKEVVFPYEYMPKAWKDNVEFLEKIVKEKPDFLRIIQENDNNMYVNLVLDMGIKTNNIPVANKII